MAFCTASDVENYVQFALSSDLETHLTNNIIPLVEAAVKEYVGYDVEQATQTETFTGDQTKDIFLTHLPVNSITSIVEDGITLTQGNENDYVSYSNGRVTRIGGRWSYLKPLNIVVTYNAGYYARSGSDTPKLPIQFKAVAERASARILESTLVIASQQEAAEIKGQTSSEVSNFTMADSQRVGDYSISYPGGLALNAATVLTASDLTLLAPFRRQFFV
tara:strand:+ start:662 stop:1318 length:657 start_codon:yes stop_codon:yes gene_type:complete